MPLNHPPQVFKLPLVSALLVTACMSLPAAANLVSNSSFEDPVVSNIGFTLVASGGSFAGWNVVGAAGNVALISGLYTEPGFSFPAQDGAQWLDLTGNTNSAVGIGQIITTVANSEYHLSFWVGNLVDPSTLLGTASAVEVFLAGVSHGLFVNSDGAGSTALNWKEFSVDFIATSNSTALRFFNRDPSGDHSNGLDNVSVVASTVVPLPPAVGLLGSAVVLLGGFLQRRARSV